MPRIHGLLLGLLCLWPLAARAETPGDVPNPQKARRSWVADNAHVLSADNVRRLDKLIGGVKAKSGAEIAVVTVRSLGSYAVDDFANLLFNRWGVGRKNHDDGVLILAAIDDHKLRIEVGDGLNSTLSDDAAAQIIASSIVPRFKADDYNGGLYDGTLAVARRIAPAFDSLGKAAPNLAQSKSKSQFKSQPKSTPRPTARATARATARPVPFAGSAPNFPASDGGATAFQIPNSGAPASGVPGSGGSALLWLAVLGGGGGVMAAIYLGSRPPKCPRCQGALELVPEFQEDAFLTDVQQLEESMGGREWNVWRCPRDDYQTITPHDKWLSQISQCQSCGNRTATSNTRVLQTATELSSGLEETDYLCHNPACRHSWSTQRTIPRVTPTPVHSSHSSGFSSSSSSDSSSSSSSDSGGSFGGGHSSGGGASGSW